MMKTGRDIEKFKVEEEAIKLARDFKEKAKEKYCANQKALLILAFALLAFAAPALAQEGNFCFEGTGCRGTELCQTETCVDFSGRTTTNFISCRAAGLRTFVCPDGSPVSCQNTCEDGIGGATIRECNVNAQCRNRQATRPTAILPFSTVLKRNPVINITPARFVTPSPRETTYQVSVRNPNSIDLTYAVNAQLPQGWRATFPQQLALRAGESRTFNLVVVPQVNSTTATQTVQLANMTNATFTFLNSSGLFDITVGVFDQRFRTLGTARARYEILPPNFPNVTVQPPRATGIPGSSTTFSIIASNRDPAGFPETLFIFSALVPFGWRSSFSSPSALLRPGDTQTVSLTVTSNISADEGENQVVVSARTAAAEIPIVVTQSITLCGDGVCQIGEETSCSQDCPGSPFRCLGRDGRCETAIDYGVDFNSSLTQTFTGFYTCSRNASLAQCRDSLQTNDCGFGRPCLCGNLRSSSCQTRCVDGRGVYYMAADTASSTVRSANYSFSCPFVNLPEVVEIRNNITDSRINFERGKDVLDERIRSSANARERGEFLACSDALGIIIRNMTALGQRLDSVIDFPGIRNTTEARRLNNDNRNGVNSLFNTYCRRTVSGALQIQNITSAPSVEIGRPIAASVAVRNAGNVDYYGYAECDFAGPAGTQTSRGACTFMPNGQERSFSVAANASSEGRWQLQCRVIGSLQADCSSELHDESGPVFFDVFSKNIFVSNVAGEIISNDVICTVTTSREASCVDCRLGTETCQRIGSRGSVTSFRCPLRAGTQNVTGFVFDTPSCIAAEPKSKSAVVRVPGCGDGVPDRGEACDPAYRGEQCVQTGFECRGKQYGSRPRTSLCSASCTCQQQNYTFTCLKDQCDAECSTGETQSREVQREGRTYVCTQRCTAGCSWSECFAPGFVYNPATGESRVLSSILFDPIYASGTASPGTSIDYMAILRNIGERNDTYAFRVESGNAAILIGNTNRNTVSLNINASADVLIRIVPAARTAGERDVVNISVESQETAEKKSALFVTVISDVANRPPQIRSVAHAPDSVREGDQIRFSADFFDPNGDQISNAFVCADAECRSVLCRLVQRDVFTCSYSTISSGHHGYYVRAEDAKNAFSVSDVRSFKVDAGEVRPVQPSVQAQPGRAPEAGFNPLLAALVITIIIVVVVVVWVKKESIMNRLSRKEKQL